MPPRKQSIGRYTRKSIQVRGQRKKETSEERKSRIDANRSRSRQSRDLESNEHRQSRLQQLNLRASTSRAQQSSDQRDAQRERDRLRKTRSREKTSLKLEAFNYDKDFNYSEHPDVVIGQMDRVCSHCKALKFMRETPGMCCSNGKVVLPALNDPPEPLSSYVSGVGSTSIQFLKNIRKYNSSFQMTSFGATKIVSESGFTTTFKVQGQVYHKIGSLLPPPESDSRFLQIYFMGDEQMETDRRCAIFSGTEREINSHLRHMFHEYNELVKFFVTAKEQMLTDDYRICIRADRTPTGEHEGRFNAPTTNDVAIVIVGEEFHMRDIVIKNRNVENEGLQRVCETHRSYDALQYPILFWQGEDGYHFNIMQIDPETGSTTTKKVSSMSFYAYRIMIRADQSNHILKCRQLFHQFIVDMYAKIESERLLFIRLNQKKLRVENYIHLRDAIANDGNLADMGQMLILPATYTGSPRHMNEYAQDAMTYVRKYGCPDLFITFTCNPTWPEFSDLLLPGQATSDRHDLAARVFKQKLIRLIDLITKNHIYGETRCWMYSIEWQKRGLPHAHILVWLKVKIVPTQIDSIISAELPDPEEDPELFEVVKKNMIHGPCGALNTRSPCMKDGKCTKQYPREMLQQTQTGGDGYPKYRRRKAEDGGHTATIKVKNVEIEVDNRFIVPYTPLLLKTFKAHINVEYCSSVKSIKYICKYVTKGSDMAVFEVSNQRRDEITNFQTGRYISSNEAVWRILGFNIHERYPTVLHLSVHLENGQRVYFTEANALVRAAEPPNTTLTAFFQLCATDEFAKTLLYHEVAKYYTWNATNKQFLRRKQGAIVPEYPGIRSADALGRVYTVHPNNAECFYLRMLLHVVRGPSSFQVLKTFQGEVFETYREACLRRGLLEDDQHWDTALSEASATRHPARIRNLFAIILTTCAPSNPEGLWEKNKEVMSEDVLHRARTAHANMDIIYSEEIFNEALILLEDKCISINNKTLCQLGLPAPDRTRIVSADRDILRERLYDVDQLRLFSAAHKQLLVEDQRVAFNAVMQNVEDANGGLIFLDAPGGTGKTFLLNLVLAEIRSQNGIALAVASSGIASTLLDGGRTAHSALKLPLNLQQTETPTCNISKTSGMATVLKECKLIIWDECTMAHKKALEAIDRTLQDVRGNDNPFGGALILLAGDFRQTLPVIPRSTPADELDACLKASFLWRIVKKLTLSTNMRVRLLQDASLQIFANQLLDMGNGKIPVDDLTQEISFPTNFCQMQNSIEDVIENVFPDISNNFKNHDWLYERAILAPKNEDVDKINNQIQCKISGTDVQYRSIDTVVQEDEVVNYPIEFLNSLEPSGMPPHILHLKVGSPIMLLRNLDPPKLCNGTRLAVKKLTQNVIEATIISGKNKGEDVLIPRIPMISNDLPFEFKRLQFPVRLAFAITINKSQGQSLRIAGLNLENPCFSHGQLYVACSRVGNPQNLYIFTPNGKTKNIVYPAALE